MGKVGDDPFGHFLAQTLADAGVDVGPLRFTAQARTALAFVSLRADGEREFMFYRHPSADMLLTPDEIDERRLRRAKALHFGSISLIGEPVAQRHPARDRDRPARRLPDLLRPQSAARAVARPGGRPRRPAARDRRRRRSSRSATRSCASSPARTIRPPRGGELWHDRLELMVVTLGSAGSVYFTRDHEGVVVGFGVTAVDATGAGDGFVAGLLHGADRRSRR